MQAHVGVRPTPPRLVCQQGWSPDPYPDACPMHTRSTPDAYPDAVITFTWRATLTPFQLHKAITAPTIAGLRKSFGLWGICSTYYVFECGPCADKEVKRSRNELKNQKPEKEEKGSPKGAGEGGRSDLTSAEMYARTACRPLLRGRRALPVLAARGRRAHPSCTGFTIISTTYVSTIRNGSRHPNALCAWNMLFSFVLLYLLCYFKRISEM